MIRQHLLHRFILLAQLLIIVDFLDVGVAFVPNGSRCSAKSRSFVPKSIGAAQQIFYGNEGGPRSRNNTNGDNNKRRRKKDQSNKNNTKNSRSKKSSRPASFAAIRKEMQKGSARRSNSIENDGAGSGTSVNIIDSATITKISQERHRERMQEQQAKIRAKEERQELKVKAYQLSIESERGFRSTPEQAKKMRAIIDRLTELNPSTEPAWSYYGKNNPLTRQLYQSLSNRRGKTEKKKDQIDADDLASLEGKWMLTYTNVPSIVSLATDSNRLGFAKLGRIGQECTPFPDYTVQTVIEWKRPDWVSNLETTPGMKPASRWLFGKAQSSVLQKTTLRARANPDDPSSLGVSTIPRVFEVVSSRSSSALYDDEGTTTTSFVTDDGLLALDPLKPLKIGLQIAGMDDEQGLFAGEETEKKSNVGTKLVTKNGMVALNPFQPWTVGLQMAGFARHENGKRANEPWKIDEQDNGDHTNLFEDIQKRGLVEGILHQTPIQLSLQDNDQDDSSSPGNQRILYLDDDIRIIGDGENHFTIESRACTEKDEDCWF